VKKRKRHSPDEIINRLREAEVDLGHGEPLAAILQRFGVSEQTYYRWKKRYGGMKAPDARRLKELEKENARLKKMVADQALDIDMLKEVARGNF
jgi:putative transposase